jgi:hypothetical protein
MIVYESACVCVCVWGGVFRVETNPQVERETWGEQRGGDIEGGEGGERVRVGSSEGGWGPNSASVSAVSLFQQPRVLAHAVCPTQLLISLLAARALVV